MTERESVLAIAVFCGDLPEVDADRAACELERAGFQVNRLPDKLAALLAHPLDDFLEAIIEVDDLIDQADPLSCKVLKTVHDQVESVVRPFGGYVDQWGKLDDDHVPFEDVFSPEIVTSDAPWSEALLPRKLSWGYQ